MVRPFSDWVDRRAPDRHGELIGVVVDAPTDVGTRPVRRLAVATGFFGTRLTVVPVRSASRLGDDVVIAHDRRLITSCPPVSIVVGARPTSRP